MEKVLGNIAASVAGNPGAPKLLTGTGGEFRSMPDSDIEQQQGGSLNLR
jgi:hypothetical protein